MKIRCLYVLLLGTTFIVLKASPNPLQKRGSQGSALLNTISFHYYCYSFLSYSTSGSEPLGPEIWERYIITSFACCSLVPLLRRG